MAYNNCTVENTLNDCPINSICTKNSTESFSCICLENFALNPAWLKDDSNSSYCLQLDESLASNSPNYYMKPKPTVEQLAWGIILVMLVAILTTALVYLLIVYNPIKRTKRAYEKMQLRRDNHHKLREMDEIVLSRQDTLPQMYI